MEKTYSTHTLFNCYLKDIKETGNVIDLSNAHLKQSLGLLSTVLNIFKTNGNQTSEAKTYLQNFERIERYKGKLPKTMDDYWSIEEMTILIIMLSSNRRKRYNSMIKTIEKYNDKYIIPSEKVLKHNRDWLLEAYKCLGSLKHTDWTKEINKEILDQTFEGKMNVKDSHKNVMEVKAAIIKSRVLDAEMESEIGQILAHCAFPELLKESRETLVDQIVNELSKFLLALEKVEGDLPQNIAMNESIKKMRQLTEEIEYSYDVSKYYTDAYWEKPVTDDQGKETLLKIEKLLKKTYLGEIDILSKNTL
ncbi:hypothetical protein BBH88_03310 [Planococcus antarcticus DSM 14505]|uniref:Uncharacterized protein n=1 Tax=Planococcus antarcticus DSM 14505 TaxID=1185653 RepID=A0ABN4RBE0_9BACL|nr:hypothetical protein [Planococcus antarcticus]ANU09405.1 hypothetical protein BBH88_03310 [Planococcus antarcticus DSM 14505]